LKKTPTKKVFASQLTKLREVESDLSKEGLPLTNKNLLLGLEKKGMKNVDRNKLYHLKKTLGENNQFVLSIAQGQYSSMVQDIYEKIMIIEDECYALAKQDWTQHETETSIGDGTENDRQTYTKNKTVDNEHKPKHDFYKLALDCQTAKTKILSGDVINVSVAMIEGNFARIRDENAEYVKEIQRLREKNEKLEKQIETD
jgi:hypothetical protein